MEQNLRLIYQERASDPTTLGVLLVSKSDKDDPTTDMFDAILLIITSDETTPIYTKHYATDDGDAAMHVISDRQLKKWLIVGSKRKVIDWLFNGIVYFDRNEYVENLKKQLRGNPYLGQGIKMGLELSSLVRAYMEGKKFYEQQNYLDAYHHVVNSLHHLARLAVIEKGLFPEVKVWNQVKKIDPAISKLYEELVTSDETLGKRLELLFLASEFFIYNRTEKGAAHILSVMSKSELWTIQDLHEHEELQLYSVNLEVYVEYLVKRGFIQVVEEASKNPLIRHRLYSIMK